MRFFAIGLEEADPGRRDDVPLGIDTSGIAKHMQGIGRYTPVGETVLTVAVEITSAIETEYEARIGTEQLQQLRELLADLTDRL